MTIEAPVSKFKKSNLKIYIIVCIALAAWCAYDGYFNNTWIQEHTDSDGKAEPYLVFNKNAPPYLVGAAALFGVWLFAIGNKKIIADENELIIDGKERISYDSIQKIDKTHFDSKGFFLVTYKDENEGEINRKISNRKYDNLSAVLEHLVTKISG